MFSDIVKAALEAEVIGQPRAVHGVVRGVTWAASGMSRDDGPLCTYMFMGPSGTGKTHLVEVLARTLHGDSRRMAVADCTYSGQGDPWTSFVAQFANLFAVPRPDDPWSVLEAPPLSILLIEYLERARPEVIKTLAAALETMQLTLPEGRRGSLRNCLVFITSALCSREILDAAGARIGFSGSGEDETEQARIYKQCSDAAHQQYGTNMMARMDDLIVFHRLQESHKAEILDRLIATLNAWLRPRKLRCEVHPEAREFLLERGRRNLAMGARELLRAHRRFVEFPLADLVISGRVPAEGLVVVDHRPPEKNLHFTVSEEALDPRGGQGHDVREVPLSA
jgi:ATP-dependent Clp protease ATP-binding subunit ClpC